MGALSWWWWLAKFPAVTLPLLLLLLMTTTHKNRYKSQSLVTHTPFFWVNSLPATLSSTDKTLITAYSHVFGVDHTFSLACVRVSSLASKVSLWGCWDISLRCRTRKQLQYKKVIKRQLLRLLSRLWDVFHYNFCGAEACFCGPERCELVDTVLSLLRVLVLNSRHLLPPRWCGFNYVWRRELTLRSLLIGCWNIWLWSYWTIHHKSVNPQTIKFVVTASNSYLIDFRH